MIIPRKSRAATDRRRSLPSIVLAEIGKEIFLSDPVSQYLRYHPDNIIVPGTDPHPIVSYYFPQDPFYSISPGGLAAFFRHHQAKTADRRLLVLVRAGRRLIARFFFLRPRSPVENKPFSPKNVPIGKNGLNISCAFQPAISRKSVGHRYFLRDILLASRFLPLARRRESTARPLLVDIRLRNP